MEAIHADFEQNRKLMFCSHRGDIWNDSEVTPELVRRERLTRCRGCGIWSRLWANEPGNAPSDHLVGNWSQEPNQTGPS